MRGMHSNKSFVNRASVNSSNNKLSASFNQSTNQSLILIHWYQHRWAFAVEHFVNVSMPYLVIILGIMIILEILNALQGYDAYVSIIDGAIVSFFIVDLIFKWIHVPHLTAFVKLYWLDILAVFPFYLVFRASAQIFQISGLTESTNAIQQYSHEAVLLRETRLIREAELLQQEERLGVIIRESTIAERAVKAIARFIRALKGRLTLTHDAMQSRSKNHVHVHDTI